MLNTAEKPLYLPLNFVQYLEGDQQLGMVAFLIRPILEVLCQARHTDIISAQIGSLQMSPLIDLNKGAPCSKQSFVLQYSRQASVHFTLLRSRRCPKRSYPGHYSSRYLTNKDSKKGLTCRRTHEERGTHS